MPSRPDPPYFPPHVIAGKYALRRILGEGGAAVVYSAVDVTCNRHVALKIVRPGVAGRRAVSGDLAQREAATVVKLHERTPHVVEVLTAGVTDDAHRLPYFVMERLRGTTLRASLDERCALHQPFDLLEIASLSIDLAMPLAEAHELGIVHRDVKPENVFLAVQRDRTCMVKLLDFGISALVEDGSSPTRPRVFSGSRPYASPEQLEGRPTTPASDVYSLGLLMYELLTFTLPHGRRDPSLDVTRTAHNVLCMPLVPLRTLRSDVPARLEVLVENCLEHRPALRPTAHQVASKLRDVKGMLERDLLGHEDVNVTDVSGPPPAVMVQNPVDTPVAPLAMQPIAVTVPLDHDVFFDNPVARTEPLPLAPVAVPPWSAPPPIPADPLGSPRPRVRTSLLWFLGMSCALAAILLAMIPGARARRAARAAAAAASSSAAGSAPSLPHASPSGMRSTGPSR